MKFKIEKLGPDPAVATRARLVKVLACTAVMAVALLTLDVRAENNRDHNMANDANTRTGAGLMPYDPVELFTPEALDITIKILTHTYPEPNYPNGGATGTWGPSGVDETYSPFGSGGGATGTWGAGTGNDSLHNSSDASATENRR